MPGSGQRLGSLYEIETDVDGDEKVELRGMGTKVYGYEGGLNFESPGPTPARGKPVFQRVIS